MDLVRYRTVLYDSARWEQFELRAGDIVISTPPKAGTTWTQMLVALMLFGADGPPAPLAELSPWLDMCDRPMADVRAALDPQLGRRFIKTHTPLDGVPRRDDVTYVVVGRDPRDILVSFEHHIQNMDIDRFLEMRDAAIGNDDLVEFGPPPEFDDDPSERFRSFVHEDDPLALFSLRLILHHLDTGWQRRRESNLVLCHYADYRADLPGELVRLGAALGFDLSPEAAAELAGEAGIDRMRDRADELAPSATRGLWKDPKTFFRSGGSGEWRDRATESEVEAYEARVGELIDADLAAWVHQGRLASGVDPKD